MTSSSTAVSSRLNIQWFWKTTDNPYKNADSDDWRAYSDIETQMIEEAYARQEPEALLDDYHINFKHLVQISNDDMKSQRPVKRVVNECEQASLRDQRFMPNPISPSTPFSDVRCGNFVRTVRQHFNFDQLKLNDDAERRFLVEKAAEGFIIEGKKVSKQKEAQWMAQHLLNVINGSRQEVWECCVRLYCLESFIYVKMNEWMRLIDEEEQEQLWKSKISTFGPFACLLFVPSGANLSEKLIEHYRQKSLDKDERFIFPAFTSTSRNRRKAEQFGNVLFIIEISEYDGYDVAAYSNYDEEEQLIKPAFSFYIRSCEFDHKTNKWIILLKSHLSL